MTPTDPSITRNGRRVVLKRLDDDCLLDGQLHPSIRLRLERVRELPVKCVANLLGVERDASGVPVLVWEFLPGTPLADVRGGDVDWLRLCREVVLAVQSLHTAGIVHGAIHARNAILDDATGEIRLTHVSPLLYTDPDSDAADVTAMLDARVHEHAPDSKLARVLAGLNTRAVTLEELYAALAGVDAAPPPPPPASPERDARRRLRMVAAAVLVALIGVVASLAVYWRMAANESQPYAPPVARGGE